MTYDQFTKKFAPLYVNAVIPSDGGDWSCLLWMANGHRSWWAGNPISKTLTEEFIVTFPTPRNDDLE